MGKRGRQPWSREELPVGTVRIRQHSKRCSVRMIKIRSDGPKGRRWITLARHWWLANRGPIPPGMRVVHRDGDVLNDDPANYALVTGGEVAKLARQWDPTLAERNASAVRRAMQVHNAERSRVRRAAGYLPAAWYPVDFERGLVIDDPARSAVELYRRYVEPGFLRPNGGGMAAAWLGWPQCTSLGACLLAALIEKGSVTLLELAPRVEDLRKNYRLRAGDVGRGTFVTELHRLRRRGFVRSFRVPGVLHRIYVATPEAAAARCDRPPILPVRGRDIPDLAPYARKIWTEQCGRFGAIYGPASRVSEATA